MSVPSSHHRFMMRSRDLGLRLRVSASRAAVARSNSWGRDSRMVRWRSVGAGLSPGAVPEQPGSSR